ncbi:MAG: hypothetical protein ACLP2Y_02975 [Limisphaerales bacterium]
MADSTDLKNIIEPFIVQWVSQRIGVALQSRRFPVGPRTDGAVVNFEFDGVSEDGQTGLLVSASHTVKPGGTRKLHVDASILLRAGFQRRIMAFVSDDVRQNFLNKCDGLLELSKIEMLVCDKLPPEMQAAIANFQAEAKSEVGDKGKQWKPGGQRR